MTKQPCCFIIVAGERFINIHGKLTTVCTTKHELYVDNDIAQSSSQFGNYKYRYCKVMGYLEAHSVDGTDKQVGSRQPLDTNVVTEIL